MLICRKTFILAILFFAFLSVKSYSEIVEKIEEIISEVGEFDFEIDSCNAGFS